MWVLIALLLSWIDPSPHKVHFVAVEPGVQLEVLEWTGAGGNVVLLTGSGNTAHVYDDFALRLPGYHVWAVTRRGFGLSSKPETGYTDARLAADVVAVLDALKIEAPILVGHSMAGAELTTIGREHPSRISGLVYLDAGADPAHWPWSNPQYRELVGKLPKGEDNARTAKDKASAASFQGWMQRALGFAFLEAELRNQYEFGDDGSIGPYRTPQRLRDAIDKGAVKRDYSGIRVPVLSIFVTPQTAEAKWRSKPPQNEEHRKTSDAVDAMLLSYIERYAAALREHVPDARILEWPGANHYLFLVQQDEVLREVHAFLNRPRGLSRFDGVWRGEMDGLPALDITFSAEGRELSGAVLFYRIHRTGEATKSTPGHPEPLFDLKVNGDEVSFLLSHRRSHGERTAHDPPISFRVRLTGDGATLFGGAAGGEGLRLKRLG